MSRRFITRKQKILALLDAPEGEYHDLSPKGSIDAPIRSLISDINHTDGLVTTSSCSGRICVFLEGRKAGSSVVAAEPPDDAPAGPGGKGGGAWLFVSHDPVQAADDIGFTQFASSLKFVRHERDAACLPSASRYIHFKFEPMVRNVTFFFFFAHHGICKPSVLIAG